ncbi:MAG: hypothetical protein EB824_01065 [Thaumarchaeota archaeon S15]|nr:MAG: hypothetical protein EB824_01065 [Thaumarchaeota archaeon S15]
MGLVRARVHVAPVGYEIDRIVLPAVELKAERVWLLVHDKPNEDRATGIIERVAAALEGEGIAVAREAHDRRSLFGIIRAVRGILEREEGNDVFVNLASGSKIQAVAGMKIVPIPSYEIRIPEERLVRTLGIMAERGGKITKKELAEAADRQGIISVGSTGANYSQARFAMLDKGIIRPLEAWGFVEVKKVGRNRWVSLTEEGRNATEILL